MPDGHATALAIVATAERLFREIGYQKTTVADIARELRMSPANVYRFYASKAAINEAVCARLLTGLHGRTWEIARGPGDAAARLRAVFSQLQADTLRLFFHEKRMHDMVEAALAEHWDVIDAHVGEIEAALAHIVREGVAAGEFAAVDVAVIAPLVHMTLVGFTHPAVITECNEPDDLPARAAAMAEFVLRALRHNPKTDGY